MVFLRPNKVQAQLLRKQKHGKRISVCGLDQQSKEGIMFSKVERIIYDRYQTRFDGYSFLIWA